MFCQFMTVQAHRFDAEIAFHCALRHANQHNLSTEVFYLKDGQSVDLLFGDGLDKCFAAMHTQKLYIYLPVPVLSQPPTYR